jgi:hypothetical protein
MNDLFPRGSLRDRRRWASRHPWLAGLYLAVIFVPVLSGAIALSAGSVGVGVLVGAVLFFPVWIGSGLLVTWSYSQVRGPGPR